MRTGLHCNSTRNRARLLWYYQRSMAPTVKVLTFDDDVLGALKDLGVTIIGRVYQRRQSLGAAGDEFIDRVVRAARRHPLVDYWEGYNEAHQTRESLHAFARHEMARIDALERVGAKAIIGSFSTGMPDLNDWELFYDALDRGLDAGAALGLHEYSGPYMPYMIETPDGRNQWRRGEFTGASAEGIWDPDVEGWLTLRYRKVATRLAEWGFGRLPIYITESGIDDVNPRPGGHGKGYKDWAGGEWSRLDGIGDYAAQRLWYSTQLSHDEQIAGVVDFGWDTEDPAWDSFDLSTDPAMLERIVTLESNLPIYHFGDDPSTPDPPEDPRPFRRALRDAADAAQVIELNVAAALMRRIIADGYLATSDEFDVHWRDRDLVCQRAESPTTGVVRVYWVERGHYDAVGIEQY